MFVARPPGSESDRHFVSILTSSQAEACGGLTPAAIVGEFEGGAHEPEHFKPNVAFLRTLHRVIETWLPTHPPFADEAMRRGGGNVVVIDGRTPAPEGQVPLVDMLGAFDIEGGVAVRYHANREHELLTGDGWMSLDAPLHEAVVRAIVDGGASASS